METIYTRKAKNDLQSIRDYFGPRSPQTLGNMIKDITDVVDDIPFSVAKGRKTPHEDVWEKLTLKYRYLIPYYIFDGKLYILRVYDQTRGELDYDEILDLEN